ncbi:UPF0175 family protein [Candidatus Woesearchaeota archaeon]|nr:UPF0175 family protein [Candidatus Woesearchaeota archaeon]
MAEVISFRFHEHELDHINKFSAEKKVDKTSAARELIEQGWKHHILLEYKQGKLSLGRAAKALHLPLTDFVDQLAELKIPSPISFEDYLQGLENMKE